MTFAQILGEIFYCIIGLVFILVGVKALKDDSCSKKVTTAIFWFALAFTFIAGPYVPKYMVGISGRELALEILDKLNIDYANVDLNYVDFFKSKEYWAMYMLTYYKYKINISLDKCPMVLLLIDKKIINVPTTFNTGVK